MWGIVPAAGRGSRIQPLAFSKELLPVGSSFEEGVERLRAVSDYLVERMILGGARKICFVISSRKSDIMEYYGSGRELPSGRADFCYVVQDTPAGLCDAIFRALPFIADEELVRIGLPDTIWFPADAYGTLPADRLAFLLFPVEHPEFFDAVITDEYDSVQQIRVKQPSPGTNWIWGAFQMPGFILRDLHGLWRERDGEDEYFGTLVNAWLARGGSATAVRSGESYADVGTLSGIPRGDPRAYFRRRTIMNSVTKHSPEQIERRIKELGPWFHNMELQGVRTAPDHFLGDYPAFKFRNFADALPPDLRGKSVLDIGCNGGFYSLEMKRRGADRVLGIDFDEDYLAQARFAAEVCELEIEFRKLSVYKVGDLREKFDVVIFMGVLYHLRHPLLALDLLHRHVTKDLLLFQSLLRGVPHMPALEDDYPFSEEAIFEQPGYPRMLFVEHNYSHDPTNWWLPNTACAAAMLRSSGYDILSHPEPEVFLCRHNPAGGHPVD